MFYYLNSFECSNQLKTYTYNQVHITYFSSRKRTSKATKKNVNVLELDIFFYEM